MNIRRSLDEKSVLGYNSLMKTQTEADVDDVAELDRRWQAFEAQDSVASNDDVVRWLQTWGTPAFQSWHNR